MCSGLSLDIHTLDKYVFEQNQLELMVQLELMRSSMVG